MIIKWVHTYTLISYYKRIILCIHIHRRPQKLLKAIITIVFPQYDNMYCSNMTVSSTLNRLQSLFIQKRLQKAKGIEILKKTRRVVPSPLSTRRLFHFLILYIISFSRSFSERVISLEHTPQDSPASFQLFYKFGFTE